MGMVIVIIIRQRHIGTNIYIYIYIYIYMIGLWVELEWKVLRNCKWTEIGMEIRSGIIMGSGRIMVTERQ